MSDNNNKTTPRLRFPGFTGEWQEKKAIDICNTVVPPLKLQSNNYFLKGKYPIVDQSQSLICGWTDNKAGLISNLPVIVFGDHTCVLKYIDFPFVQGADGVKILSPKEDYNAQFVYQAFSANPIKQDGYKRHFSDFKEKTFILAIDEAEQEKIAGCLMALDELIAAQGQKVDALKERKRGLMQQLFPQQGETTPRLRFSGFTGDWEEKKLDDLLVERKEVSVITKELPQLSFTIAEGVIRPEDRKSNQRDFLMKDKDNKRFSVTRLNDIIYNPANVVFGAIHKNNLCDGVVSPIYKIFWTNENADFLSYLLRRPSFISILSSRAEGTVTKLKTLKTDAFLKMSVLFPANRSEQDIIADCLRALDNLITDESNKLESLKSHKRGLMQQLFPQPSK